MNARRKLLSIVNALLVLSAAVWKLFRLMGKAYLELHQYDKAEDAFKKVLSSVPV
jgi:tetratricopeptide (TPR) repeat protein